MCSTIQYLFSCGHPATHRFRNQQCPQSTGRVCRIRDTNKLLVGECRKCLIEREQRQREVNRSGTKDLAPRCEDTWYVPTRCFIDVGFRSLDPFNAEPASEPASPLSPLVPLTPLTPLTPPLIPAAKTESAWDGLPTGKPDRSPIERLFPRLCKKRRSPCCKDKTLADAFQAVRLEDFDARIEGRIMDNHCESVL
jgi:hypothetical protein